MSAEKRVEVQRLPHADPTLPLPRYATAGAAAMDFYADLPPEERAEGRRLAPGARTVVPTGLAVAVPEGFEMQIRPRSGLAAKAGVTVGNPPGTVDSDYRGEVGVLLFNLSDTAFTISHGARIAQALLAPVTRIRWAEVDALDATVRGGGGFGSTGGVQ